MVAVLRDRPTHLQRFPDGIDGEEIYQKRVPAKHPDYLETCQVTFPSGRTADALKVTHPSAIAWAAQMGTVTLHPWQVRCPDTEHPDELRIDLDPQPGTGLHATPARSPSTCSSRCSTNSASWAIRRRRAVAACTCSSGSAPDWDFVAVRRAGIALAREVERRAPDRVTTSWWKEERGKRMFIDYNQNARDRTFASAYSVRRTPIATVSTPLTWERARRRPTRTTTPCHGARTGGGARRSVGRHRDGGALARAAAGDGRRRRGTRPRAICPTRRATRRCLASRRACSRARRWRPTGKTNENWPSFT